MNDFLDGPLGLLLQFAVLIVVLRFLDSIVEAGRWSIDRWRTRGARANKKREPQVKPKAPSQHHNGFNHID